VEDNTLIVQGDLAMAENSRFSAKGYGTLWNKLSEVAEARGWDIASLAREAKVSYGMVERLWNKESKGVHLDKLHKVAATLGVQLNVIFPITDEEFVDDVPRATGDR
jgi:transcriptional regulator with XRE-family HTH domain